MEFKRNLKAALPDSFNTYHPLISKTSRGPDCSVLEGGRRLILGGSEQLLVEQYMKVLKSHEKDLAQPQNRREKVFKVSMEYVGGHLPQNPAGPTQVLVD